MCKLGYKTAKPCLSCVHSPLRLLDNSFLEVSYDKGVSENVKSKCGVDVAYNVTITTNEAPQFAAAR